MPSPGVRMMMGVSPRGGYLFPNESPQAAALARKAGDPPWGYALARLDGYVIYTRQR